MKKKLSCLSFFLFLSMIIFIHNSFGATWIAKTNWELDYVDSEEVVGENGHATNVLDGNPNTFWHTQWLGASPSPPHEIWIDLMQEYSILGFSYLPRQDGGINGRIGQYEFYVSEDGVSWGSPVASGTFANSSSEKDVTFTAKTGRFIRLRALTEVNGNPWTSMAEIGVFADVLNSNPVVLIPKTNWELDYVDSEEVVGENGHATNTFDGNPNTIWHTRYLPTSPSPPHEIWIDLMQSFPIVGFRYLPRQDGGVNGRIGQYEFYVSEDGLNWGSPVVSGLFANNSTEKEVTFNSHSGRFIRFRALTEANGNPWTAMAEISLLGDLLSMAPNGSIDLPSGNVSITAGNSVSFSATASDPDNNLPLTYLWNFGSGSGITDRMVEDPGAIQFNNPGTYTVTFTVTNALGFADPTPATRVVTVTATANQAPNGSIDLPSGNVSITAGNSVSFSATASDPDNNLPLTYLWTFGSGSGITNRTVEDPGSIQFNNPGAYTVTFTVTDALGLADPTPATRVVTVTATANQAPNGSIDLPSGNVSITAGNSVSFSATASDSDNNLPLTYLWTFSSGSGISDRTVEDPGSIQFNNPGTYTVTFTVTDALGLADTTPATRVVTVTAAANQAPNGSIDLPSGNVSITAGNSVSFSATASDPDNNLPLTYMWTFGSGSGISDRTVEDPGTIQFNNPGTYTVTFTVTDALGLADPSPATRVVTVTAANQAPNGSIDLPNGNVSITAGNSVTFRSTASDSDNNLPLTYLWTFGSGSGITDRTVEDPGSIQFNNPGTYTVTFTVTDSLGLADPTPATLVVTVQNASSGFVPNWSNITQAPFPLYQPNGVFNPVIQASDVTDVQASYVADPFIFNENGTYYMFFEAYSDRGRIALATSPDGLHWTYDRIVLQESFHLSFPYIFKYNGRYFMIPETYMANGIRLYEATNFPYGWQYVTTLASGRAFVDPSIFYYNNTWWMFASDTSDTNCYLFYSDDLFSGWTEHPMSPVVRDASSARSAGRMLVYDTNKIIRFAQKNNVSYGEQVRAFQIDTLTRSNYSEHEILQSPLFVASGTGWNASGMHQFDPWWTGSEWICTADGVNGTTWSIGIYSSTNPLGSSNIIPQTNWQLRYVDSQELVGENGSAINAFDGNPNTIWHTQYIPTSPSPPHEIQIDLGQRYSIAGFRYLPRQHGEINGTIRQYEFYVSEDGVNWGSPVASGTFTNNSTEKEITFSSHTGQFIRLRALTEVNGNPWTSMAEINVLGEEVSDYQAPNGIIDQPSGNVTITAGSSVTFSGSASDQANNLPLTYLWSFGTGSGVADQTVEDPGAVQFNNPGTYTVTFTVTDALGNVDPSPATRMITVTNSATVSPISQTGWSLRYVDSQELVGENGAATNAFDGNPNTIWHTQYIPTSPSPPHEIQIDLGQQYSIVGFRYLPRQNGEVNGTIRQYEFYVSEDGVNWGSPVASGTFANNSSQKEITFNTTTCRFIRLRALMEVNGNPWTSVAEINVLALQ